MKRTILFLCLLLMLSMLAGCSYFNFDKDTVADIDKTSQSEKPQTESLPPIDKSQYDSVLAKGDGYYLVDFFSETYASATTSYGVVDESGKWVCPLSSTNGFADAVKELMSDGYNQAYSTPEFAYLGNGIFVVKVRCVVVGREYVPSGYWNDWGFHGGCYLVDFSGNIRNSGGFMITEIYDGYAFTMHTNGRVDRLDMSGNRLEFGWRTSGEAEYIGIPSCGLVCCGNVFYDIKTGKAVIDLTTYDLVSDDCRYFEEDGTYTFEFYNPAGSRYKATIDTTGEFITNPQKIS